LAAVAAAMLMASDMTPAPNAPVVGGSAAIELDKSKDSWLNGRLNEFRAYDNDRCAEGGKSSRLGLLIWRDKKEATVDAGQPIYIRALTIGMVWNGGVRERTACVQMMRFTPQAGHSYTIGQYASGEKCPAWMVDNATEKPPESFSVVPTRWSCKAS
jgi:hypothetical protein